MSDSKKLTPMEWHKKLINDIHQEPSENQKAMNESILENLRLANERNGSVTKAQFEEYSKTTREYQAESLELLRSIDENTASLFVIIDLISQSNENQDKILEILTEIFTIAKAKEQSEAESLFKKAVKTINETVETAESVAKMTNFAVMVFDFVKLILKNKGIMM